MSLTLTNAAISPRSGGSWPPGTIINGGTAAFNAGEISGLGYARQSIPFSQPQAGGVLYPQDPVWEYNAEKYAATLAKLIGEIQMFDKEKQSVAVMSIEPFQTVGFFATAAAAEQYCKQQLSAVAGKHAGFVIFSADRIIRPKPIETEEETL